MKNRSRTTNTIYNFTSSIGGQLLSIVLQFVVRTVFISTLGKSYLGINGLFSNILSMLSLAEFGVGSAILFKLYEPIAKDNHSRIRALMFFYKKVYFWIGTAVACIGLVIIPFLPIFIKDYDKLDELKINATLIFLLYLLKTVATYLFFAYKSAIIKANQKEYLLNIVGYAFSIVAAILQIICLYLFNSFEIYVLILVLQVIGQNIIFAVMSNRMYPFLKENINDNERIENQEIKDIFKDCAAIFLYKLNSVVLKATDNIVLSIFLGLEIVGVYSNYYVFYTTIQTLFAKIYNSVSHSLGNLHATNDKKHEYTVFESVILISIILGATSGVGIFICADEVVSCWIGDEWILPQPFSLLMGIEVFTMSIRYALTKYRNTMGLFQQAKYRPLFGMIINLIVSVILVNYLGISGVLIGTIVSDWSTFMWFDPIIIHKYGFDNYRKVRVYFVKLLKYIATVIAVAVVDYYLCTNLFINLGWITPIIHAIIVSISIPTILIATSHKTDEGKYILSITQKQCFKVLNKKLK